MFATAWRVQTRDAVRSLISGLEREVMLETPASLRSNGCRGLVDGNGSFDWVQTETKFVPAGVAGMIILLR